MNDVIRALAQKKGKSVRQVEIEAGIGNGAIEKWKTSSPRLDTLEKVANVLEIEVTDLITMARGEGEDEAVAEEDNPNER